jgi:diguanylate cyclase (GGDEF)-like protein
VLTGETQAMFRDELIALANGQTLFECEGQNRTLAGDTIDIHLRWSVAPGYEETLSRVSVSIIDITARKRAERDAQKHTAQLEALAIISKALTAASLEPRAIFEILVKQTGDLVGDACVLTLVADDKEWLEVAAYYHSDPEVIPYMGEMLTPSRRRADEGIVGEIIKTGQPVFIPVVQHAELIEKINPDYKAYSDRFGIHSLLIVPLVAQGQVIGTLGVSRDRPGKPYTDGDRAFLQNLASHAALTIMNARLHDLIRSQAQTDALTGIHTRRYFFSLAQLEFGRSDRHGHTLSAIMLDLDHFKDINDTFGHDVGDQVLQVVSKRCYSQIRASDMIGRYGGEEFIVLLPETGLEGALSMAERLRSCVAEAPVEIDNQAIPITISLGVACKSKDVLDLAALLRKVDQAMYSAKRVGRNQVAYAD